MSNQRYTPEFKDEAVRQVVDRGYRVAEVAVNHQVVREPVVGRDAIRDMFASEFGRAIMICQPLNIFQDGDLAILEWTDPKGLRGCGR